MVTEALAVHVPAGYEIYDIETGNLIAYGLSMTLTPWKVVTRVGPEHWIVAKEVQREEARRDRPVRRGTRRSNEERLRQSDGLW